MTMAVTKPWVYSAGGATEYTVPFRFFTADSLLVYLETIATGALTLQTRGAHYTVAGADNPSGGTVTFLSAPDVSTYKVLIISSEAIIQGTPYQSGGTFPAASHERALDYLTRLFHEVWLRVNRSLKFSLTDLESANADLPKAALRLGKFLYFNATTGAPEVASVDDIVKGAISAAAASAAAALVSQNAAAASAAAASAAAASAVVFSPPAAGDEYKILRADSGGTGSEYVDLTAALGRSTSKSVAGSSNVALTAAEAAAPVLILTGALTGDIDVTVPATAGAWTVYNATTGDYAVTFKPLGGAGVVLDRGQRSIVKVFSDGATMRELSRMQVVVGSVDIDLSLTGAQSVTGLAGRPTGGVFSGSVASAAGQMSTALWDGTNARLVGDRNGVGAGTWVTGAGWANLAYAAIGDGINTAYGSVAATADGFTLTRSKTGSPTGTFVLNYMLFIA